MFSTKWIIIGHNLMQNTSGIYKSHQLNDIWMCSDHKLTIFEDDSGPKQFGGKLFVKQNDQKDILFCSSPRPSTTYLQAPKSTPDYFQAERSFSGNRQVILKQNIFCWTLTILLILSSTHSFLECIWIKSQITKITITTEWKI